MTTTSLTQPLHVAVMHERPILRRGLAGALAEAGTLLVDAETGSAEAYIAQAPRHAVVFASLAQGLALLRHWRVPAGGRPPAAAAVAIIDVDLGEVDARDALRAGARGLLELDAAPSELLECARTLAAGGHHVARPLAALLAQQVYTQPLTSREEQVLQQIYKGCCNKIIARELGIAVGTVKTHVKAILSKLDASSRTEAVAVAKRRGLVRGSRVPDAAAVHDTRNALLGAATGGLGFHAKLASSPLPVWADSYQFRTAA